VKSLTSNTLTAPGAEYRNVCFEGISICVAIYHCPFKNSGFVQGSNGLSMAHFCHLASRMEFNHREADSALVTTFKISASIIPVSSEKDSPWPILETAYLCLLLCLERARIFRQLSAIRYEDPLD
jgi:hypothetical protein